MDRRTVLAFVLVAAVIVLTPILFPSAPVVRPPVAGTGPDSGATVSPPGSLAPTTVGAPVEPVVAAPAGQNAAPVIPVEVVEMEDAVARYRFSNVGAVLESVDLPGFGALGGKEGVVGLRGRQAPLVRMVGLSGGDTIRFDTARFTVSRTEREGRVAGVRFSGGIGADSLTVDYRVVPDSFLLRMEASARGRLAQGAGFVLLELSPTLESFEADTVDDQRNLAFAYEPDGRDSRRIRFSDLDPGERRVAPGPHRWVALKNKYFIVGVLAREGETPIVEFGATGLARQSRLATLAQGTVVIRPTGGDFALDLYAGPQQWDRLRAVGRNFDSSNPYGGFLQPVVQPFAVLVMRVLLWMRRTLDISYGWVLVIFGVAVRLVLWPLNQKAMRTSMKMQRLQPELQELQARYKSDPQKLQGEMMRVYKEHGMSPFSMFSGCLPLLIPMPVLFALFFVFQSTIEFRGVSFMWLADISLKDPFYILPVVMGASMFVLSWIGSRNTPPNPQTKMMLYLFPVMMTFLLANLAAGLNLYYAVQNLAALPQQWLIAKERARAAPLKK